MSDSLKSWTHLDTRVLLETRIFDILAQRMRSPDGSYESDFYCLRCVDWVNVIPITPAQEVVMVRQYRHGIHEATLEIPGGMTDANSEPMQCATRELEEETGYVAPEVESLGFVHPNPAIQQNRCHYFVGRGAKKVKEQNLDPAEFITVELVPLSEIPARIVDGDITHALTIAAFTKLFSKNA